MITCVKVDFEDVHRMYRYGMRIDNKCARCEEIEIHKGLKPLSSLPYLFWIALCGKPTKNKK